ncbi:MAG: replication factor A1 [archaeon GW2011_AR3]|nr:MAG: replication factor A1 [archaeon GW2011_AR3]MBS3109218.1 DUF2240 family protein [Candidatus Woesearchaeota archaeon]
MIKVPIEDIRKRISEQAKLSEAEIDTRIEKKMEQLSGLISREGAAHIIANELGVRLFEVPSSGPVQIKNIMAGMKSVETAGRVQQVYEVRNFNANGREGKVGSFVLADETGNIRVVLWNDQVSNMDGLKQGQIVKLESAYAKDNRGRKELHINDRSKLVVNPLGIRVAEAVSSAAERPKATRKSLKDLSENDDNVEIAGTIVQAFNIRFFEVCPSCGRRAKERGEDGFYCDQHARVEPQYSYVLNTVLDDGTGTIRSVMFRNQVERLLGKSADEMKLYREAPEEFENVKRDLIGNMVKFIGRVNKNEMFDRLEFVANMVFTDINPEDEIKRLEAEIEATKKEKDIKNIEDI